MNKRDLVSVVRVKLDLTWEDANNLVNTVLDSVVDGVVQDGNVNLPGFGIYHTKLKPARQGRNPFTGSNIDIPSRYRLGFRAGKAFKEAVRNMTPQ